MCDRSEDIPGPEAIIRNRIHFPDSSAAGWFDYATGIVGVNDPYLDSDYDDSNSDTEMPLNLAVLTHEKMHLLQACAYPFFSRWCISWRDLVLRARVEGSVPGESLSHHLDAIETRLSSGLRAEINAHLGLLTSVDHGVSVLDLLEAGAVFGELWTHFTFGDEIEFHLQFQEHCSLRSYRHAFDVARVAIGERAAIEMFPGIVAAAFCFHQPLTAFDRIIASLAMSAGTEIARRDVDQLCVLAGEVMLREGLYDFVDGQVHAFARFDPSPFMQGARRVESVGAELGQSVAEVLADPLSIRRTVLSLSPAILWGVDDTGHSRAQVGLTDRTADESAASAAFKRERVVMTTSQRLLKLGANQERSAAEGSLSWMRFVGVETLPLTFQAHPGAPIEYQGLPSLIQQLSLHTLRAPVLMSSVGVEDLGRRRLEFVTTSSAEVWQDPWVRAVVRALRDLCPEFPLYLDPEPRHCMAVIWFGSLADEVATFQTGIDAAHPSVQREVDDFRKAAMRCGSVTGLDFTPLVTAFLAPFAHLAELPN